MAKRPIPRKGADGNYHAWPIVGTKPNGRPDQRHINRASYEEVDDEITRLLAAKRAGTVTKAGPKPTVAEWLETFLTDIAPRRCSPDTIRQCRAYIKNWVGPTFGIVRVDDLRADQLDALYVKMGNKGRAVSTQANVHGFLSRAMEAARRRGLVEQNVCTLTDAPTEDRDATDIPYFDMDTAKRILGHVADRSNGARWSVALALGLRQGEALGLRWEFVDFGKREIRVWWQLKQRRYVHGCRTPCANKPSRCPAALIPLRAGEVQLHGGLILKRPKSKSRRTIPIPGPLLLELEAHKEKQAKAREAAGNLWHDHDLVFATEVGAPFQPNQDWKLWQRILKELKIPAGRVHDLRHTAGTLLLALGVDIRVVQEILGHSDIRMTQRYTHVASEMAKTATDSIGRALWQ